jgi:hypothetical protein
MQVLPVAAARAALIPLLRPHYVVRVEERVYLDEHPREDADWLKSMPCAIFRLHREGNRDRGRDFVQDPLLEFETLRDL